MRFYLLGIFFLIGVVPLFVSTVVLLNTYEDKAVNNRVSELQNQGKLLANMLLPTGYLTKGDIPEIDIQISRTAELYSGRILVLNNNLKIIKDTYSLENGRYLVSQEVVQTFRGSNSRIVSKDNQSIKITTPITDNNTNEIKGVIVMNCSTRDIYNIRNDLENRSTIFAVTLVILVMVFAIYLSGKLTKPLTNVVNSIDRLSEGYLEEGVSIKGYNEVEKISDSFNHMISRMQKLESSRQEFVSNVSHELKTPNTSIKVLSDSLLMQEDAPVELYREFLTDIAEEIEREEKIINDLLSLVKLDKKAGDLNIVSININELLEQILKRLSPIAKKQNIELIYESFRPVIAEVDEVKLSLAISNLIENAIKYNSEEGWVRVSLNADHKYFFIKVADSGIGIPEEEQDSIFERFYRVDKARSRETGGTGLGLAITRNVIQMHRGAIRVYSKEGEGTTFNVRIPLNYIS
ncbi:MAG TPA: cell wall metabolism sensor histidine kinase WalK [Clostridiales bacterium]|nr:cell wall metabolism sensor histidine kinase WalK [Clostridiales bacterium]